MAAVASSTVDLLSLDVDKVVQCASAAATDAEKAYVDSLTDEALLAQAAAVEAELAKAVAALAKKKGGASGSGAGAGAPTLAGPSTLFEGTPVDCGAIATVAIAAAFDEMDDAALKAMAAATEAELARAQAALAAKQAGGGATKPAASPAPPPSAGVQTPQKSAGAGAGAGSAEAAAMPSPVSPLARSLSKAGSKASALLDEASEKMQVPKQTLAAGLIGAAVAGGAAIVGMFARRGR